MCPVCRQRCVCLVEFINYLIFCLVSGSPFRVNVRDRLDANRVNVKMNAAMRVNVLQEIIIDGQTAGPGNPSVEITDGHGKISSLQKKNYTASCSSAISGVCGCVYLFNTYLFTQSRAIQSWVCHVSLFVFLLHRFRIRGGKKNEKAIWREDDEGKQHCCKYRFEKVKRWRWKEHVYNTEPQKTKKKRSKRKKERSRERERERERERAITCLWRTGGTSITI